MSNKLCRACLAGQESFTYFLIDNVSPEIYMYCTSIKVKPEENLPRALCNVCYDLLTKFYFFKKTCLQSQKSLLGCYSTEPLETPVSVNGNNNIHNGKGTVEDHHNNSDVSSNCFEIKQDVDTDHSNDWAEVKQEMAENLLIERNIEANDCKTDEKVVAVNKKRSINRIEGIDHSFKRQIKNKCLKSVLKKLKSKTNLNCDICGKTFSSIPGYKAHKQKHIQELLLQCTTCTKTFKTQSGLQRHIQSSHMKVDIKNLTCNICGKISKSKETLKMHLKIHGERLFLFCDICGKSCTTAHSLKSHRETHKENRERLFTCEHCGQKFFTNRILTSHVSKRHSGRRFVCDICSYPFTEKSNLVKHLLIHDGKKLYKCDICDKSFGVKSTLVEHKRIHTGERPYQCTDCPKSFLSKKRLRDHHRIHTGEKPYKCTICEQAFTQCGTLNRHMKVHDRYDPVSVIGL